MNNFNNHLDHEEYPDTQLVESKSQEETSNSPPPISVLKQKSHIALTSTIQTLDSKYVMAHHDKVRWSIICKKLQPIADEEVAYQDIVQTISFFINPLSARKDFSEKKNLEEFFLFFIEFCLLLIICFSVKFSL